MYKKNKMNIEYSPHLSTNIQIALLLIKFITKFLSCNIKYFKWLKTRIQKDQMERIDLGFILYLFTKLIWKIVKRD